MTGAAVILFATLAVPLAMLSACVAQRARDRMPALLALAPVPALVAALLAPAGTVLVLPEPPFRMTLALDAPGATLLGAAALLWIVAGAYAAAYLRGDANAGRFAEWWLLTLTGSLGVFIAADLVSFYLTYSVVSLAAWGLIGFIRFLPLGTAMPRWGEVMAAVGLLSTFYGVLVGITQENPKTVLAYSSISQMGLLSAALGMGLAAGDSTTALGTSFSAAHHVLVKGALFLAIGAAAAGGARLWPVLIPAAVLALGLGGLPLTGGALAKLAVKAQFGESIVGTVATLSAAGSTLLMLHFLRRLVQTAPRAPATAPADCTWPWLIMMVMAVTVPWALFPATGSGSSFQVFASGPFRSALWPVMLGGMLALGLWRWTDHLPRLPAGDIVVAGEAATRLLLPWGEAIERADTYLRRWPVASLLLLSLLIVLGVAMLGGG